MTDPEELGAIAACVADVKGIVPPNPFPEGSIQRRQYQQGYDYEKIGRGTMKGFPTTNDSGYRTPMPTWCPQCERNMTKDNWRYIFMFGTCPHCTFRFY